MKTKKSVKLRGCRTEKMVGVVIKGGQLSLRASVIARCGALVLMCLFCCKQLFLHFLILMITGRCVIFGFSFSSFSANIFLSLLNTENMERGQRKAGENGRRLITASEKVPR